MVRPAVLGGICLAAVVTATGAAQQASPSAADLVRGILESDLSQILRSPERGALQ